MTQAEFDDLMAKWYRSKCHQSAQHTICVGPEYEALRAAGDTIVPLLLARLERDSSMFAQYLLGDITGADVWAGEQGPAPGWRRINVRESAQAWIRWGKEQAAKG